MEAQAQAAPEAPAAPENAGSLVFTAGCEFARGADGRINVTWNNGNALQAIRGASIDYIDQHFHMAVEYENNQPRYAPHHDLARLVAGGVSPKLALIVVGMRKVALSLPNVTLNVAELHTVQAGDAVGTIGEDDWNVMKANAPSYRAIIDLSATILGLNGLSVLLKGHHYIPEDNMWARLDAAVTLEDHFSRIGVAGYEGAIFHDCLHPISLEWKVGAVANLPSVLVGHVNGVLLKRLPGIPAGTALVFVTEAALRDLIIARPVVQGVFRDALTVLTTLITEIRIAPLNWCAMFQRDVTTENMARVARVEPLAAVVYGVYSTVFTRRASILKSKAFANNAGRHPAMVDVGRNWAANLEAPETSDEYLRAILGNMARAIEAQEEEEYEDAPNGGE